MPVAICCGVAVTKDRRSARVGGVRVEGRTRNEGDAPLHRLGQQGDGVHAGGQPRPQEHAALGRVPAHVETPHLAFQRGQHHIALRLVERADGGHVPLQEAVAQHIGDHALVEAGAVQVGRLLGLQQLGQHLLRRDQVAQAQAGASTLEKEPR